MDASLVESDEIKCEPDIVDISSDDESVTEGPLDNYYSFIITPAMQSSYDFDQFSSRSSNVLKISEKAMSSNIIQTEYFSDERINKTSTTRKPNDKKTGKSRKIYPLRRHNYKVCGMKLRTQTTLAHHNRNHLFDFRFHCWICLRRYANEKNSNGHEKNCNRNSFHFGYV